MPLHVRTLRFPHCDTPAEPCFRDCTVSNTHCWHNEQKNCMNCASALPYHPTQTSQAAVLFALTATFHGSAKFMLVMPLVLNSIQSTGHLQQICDKTLLCFWCLYVALMVTRNHLGCTSQLEHSLGTEELAAQCYFVSS